MAEVIKIKEANKDTAYPTELAVAKLRAIERYCPLPDGNNGAIIKISNTLADSLEGRAIINATGFKRRLEETLKENFPEEYGKIEGDYCNITRLYIIECIVPEILHQSLATEVRKLYGIREL